MNSIVVQKIEENGLGPSLLGLGMSYGKFDMDSYCKFENDEIAAIEFPYTSELLDPMMKSLLEIGIRLMTKEHISSSESKFLRGIRVSYLVKAPRFWWMEAGTYTVGVIQHDQPILSAQSESTMHTLKRDGVKIRNFCKPHTPAIHGALEVINSMIQNDYPLREIKMSLPEAFMQWRVVTLNYEVIRALWRDRHNHRLIDWQYFLERIISTVDYPALLGINKEEFDQMKSKLN